MSEKFKENEHIPKYIKNQPWYYKEAAGKDEDYLVHHRQTKKGTLDIDNNAEPKLGPGIQDEFETVSLRKDNHKPSCLNCGSSDHSRRDCLERPKKMLRLENEKVVVKRKSPQAIDWDAKQDRWFGYTGKEYDDVIKNWRVTNEKSKPKELQEEDWDTDEEIELMKLGLYKDNMGALKQDDSRNTKLKASVRLREDKAAYLDDVNSSELKYDPKSRVYKSAELGFIDNDSHMFHRHLTGEAQELQNLNRFSRRHARRMGIRDDEENDAKAKHVLVANPTQYEIIKKQNEHPDTSNSNELPQELQAQKTKGTVRRRKDLEDLYG